MDESPWVPTLSEKQMAVFNCYKRYVLCSGGRRNGKSIACGHKVFRHLWETKGAYYALIAPTIKVAKEGGAFQDLVNIIAPIWMDAGIVGPQGMPIAYTSCKQGGEPGPVMDAATRTSRFRIRNFWGGESELILFSIDNENDIESILRSKRFSGVWISEGGNFKSDKIFKEVIQMLRMYHLQPEEHQLIIDTNPAEEGKNHWIYQKWWVERMRDEPPKALQKTDKNPHGITTEEWLMVRKDYELFEFQLEDNPFLKPVEIAELKASNCDNQGEYDRNILGLWSEGHGLVGKVFADIVDISKVFIPDSIDMDPLTTDLISGWDMGAVNNAAVLVEKVIYNNVSTYRVLNEIVSLDEKISTAAFAIETWEAMEKLAQYYGKQFIWKHWSDDNALNVWRPGAEGYDATIVYNATDKQISLQAVDKPKESVPTGIKMMRRLLMENRLFVGENCPHVKKMLLGLTETDIENDASNTHIFDALRYVIYMEERTGLMMGSVPKSAARSMHV
jgi:PBSX family phage terminase large subunit